MTIVRHIARPVTSRLRAFLVDESGVALIEFAIVLPMMLLVFAVIIEGSRMMMSYQTAIDGVRDATRYLARIVQPSICTTGGSVSGYAPKLLTIVQQGVTGKSLFPSGITITSVTPSYTCSASVYRGGKAPVAQVTANLSLTFPFSGLFTLAGGNLNGFTTTVTDQARAFGS